MKKTPENPEKTNIPFFKHVIISDSNLTNIDIPSDHMRISLIDLSNNPIESFSSLPLLINLETIIANDTLINTFEGVVEQPRISSLFLFNTPIASSHYFYLMALIAFGHTLKVINNEQVTLQNLDDHLKYAPLLRQYICRGYLIINLDPSISLFNPNTKSQMNFTAHPSQSFFEIRSDKQEENLDEFVISSVCPSKRKNRPDPITILKHHKNQLTKFHTIQKRQISLH